MLEFVFASFFLLITPGPGVLSVAGVASGFGSRAATRYLWGLCIGNLCVAATVISGLSAILFALPYLRHVLLILSIFYMIYLAAKIAFSGSKVGFIKAESSPRFSDGVALQFINPKAYLVNTLLFTGYPFWPINIIGEVTLKLVLFVAIWIPIHFAWLIAGVSLRRLDLPPTTQRLINLLMALALLLVVALAAVSTDL